MSGQATPIPAGFYDNNTQPITSSYTPATFAVSTNATDAIADNDYLSMHEYKPFNDVSKTPYSGVRNAQYKAGTDYSLYLPKDNSSWVTRNKDSIISFANSLGYAMQGVADLYNGSIAKSANYMKAEGSDYLARQNEVAAGLLMKNQRDVIRAAQMDSNVYKMQGASTKSEQRIGQAASGFAVGKGVNRVTLNTTDARVNYNVAAMMLKAGLTNAELTRKAGAYRASAEIKKGEAKAYRIMGEAEKEIGNIKAIGNFVSSAGYFFCGMAQAGAFSGNGSSSFSNNMGGTSYTTDSSHMTEINMIDYMAGK